MAWFPTALAAQYRDGLRVGISAPTVSHDPRRLLPIRIESRNHWKEGFIIGTALGGTVWALLSGTQGDDGSFTVRDAVVSLGLGALLGGVPGALIGGLFPKGEKHDSTTGH